MNFSLMLDNMISSSTSEFAKYIESLSCILCVRTSDGATAWWWKGGISHKAGVLVKIGKKEYLERLFEFGEVYLNSIDFFRNHANEEIGDSYEGALYIKDGEVSSFRRNLNYEKIFCVMDLNSFFSEYNSNPYLRYHCNFINLIIARFAFASLNGFAPGEELYVVVINDVQEFNTRFKKVCKRTNAQFVDNRSVTYYDEFSIKPKTAISPFMKRMKYKKQCEIRYLVRNKEIAPLKLNLGSLADIACISNIGDLYYDLSFGVNCA